MFCLRVSVFTDRQTFLSYINYKMRSNFMDKNWIAIPNEVDFDKPFTCSLEQNGRVFKESFNQPEPSYSRAQVLCELWEPTGQCFRIPLGNDILNYDSAWGYSTRSLRAGGDVFAPSHELAEEIVQIREGKWLPKKDDEVYSCNENLIISPHFWNGGSARHDFVKGSTHLNFPSAKQRDAFIQKQMGGRNNETKELVSEIKSLFEKLCQRVNI